MCSLWGKNRILIHSLQEIRSLNGLLLLFLYIIIINRVSKKPGTGPIGRVMCQCIHDLRVPRGFAQPYVLAILTVRLSGGTEQLVQR
jgi:hypothetical protein